jgi:class 3 adenylate cyclase/pimeloyl-ACP methyl ester carboxylesterase
VEREIRYCTTDDGVRIAYSAEGSGPTLLVAPYFLESFERDDEGVAGWSELVGRISAGRRVVRYCQRGSGLSQRDGVPVSLEGQVKDVEAIVAALGLERFDFLGWVLSGTTAIEFAARHPERVRRLVLYSSFASPTDVMPDEALDALAALCRTNWPLAAQTITDMSFRAETTEVGMEQGGVLRQNVTGDLLASFLALRYDLAESASSLRMPAMVVHRVSDSSVPFAAAQRLASLIPNARLAPLKGTINHPGLGDRGAVADAICSFLDEDREERAEEAATSAGEFRTVLFTDLVAHSELMSRLGDEEGRALLREHEEMTRAVLREHGGQEVKAMGDGFMASFPLATKAVECAIALQRAIEERNVDATYSLGVRIGMNAGEPIADGGDLFGATVILAARIAARADGGEILIPEPVRHLLAGKKFLFSDRGEYVPKGFDEAVRLYEVRWRG